MTNDGRACLLRVVVKTLLALLVVRVLLAMLSWVLLTYCRRRQRPHRHRHNNKSGGSAEAVAPYKHHHGRIRFVDDDGPSSQRMPTRIHLDPALPGSFWFFPIEPEQSEDVLPSACRHQHGGVQEYHYGCCTP